MGPVRRHVRDAAVQFRTPALDAEAQIQVSANDAAMQTDYRIRFDNFGLPLGLTVVDVLRATRQRGANLDWITRGLISNILPICKGVSQSPRCQTLMQWLD